MGGTLGRLVANGATETSPRRSCAFYRFIGILTEMSWCISDLPKTWPMIDELYDAIQELEAREADAHKARMLKRRIETLAMLIEKESSRQKKLTREEFTEVFA